MLITVSDASIVLVDQVMWTSFSLSQEAVEKNIFGSTLVCSLGIKSIWHQGFSIISSIGSPLGRISEEFGVWKSRWQLIKMQMASMARRVFEQLHHVCWLCSFLLWNSLLRVTYTIITYCLDYCINAVWVVFEVQREATTDSKSRSHQDHPQKVIVLLDTFWISPLPPSFSPLHSCGTDGRY